MEEEMLLLHFGMPGKEISRRCRFQPATSNNENCSITIYTSGSQTGDRNPF